MGRKRKYSLNWTVWQDMLARHRDRAGDDPPEENRLDEILNRPFYAAPGVPAGTIANTSVTEIDLTPRAVKGLRRCRVRTIGQLVNTPIASLLGARGFGWTSLRHIEKSLWDLLFEANRSSMEVDFSSFNRMIESFVGSIIERPRMAEIVLRRLGGAGRRPVTLSRLGEQYGITRERVRQIANQGFEILRVPSRRRALDAFWREVWRIIRESGQSCSLRIISKKISDRLGWDRQPPIGALRRLMQLHPWLRIDGDRRVSIRIRGSDRQDSPAPVASGSAD